MLLERLFLRKLVHFVRKPGNVAREAKELYEQEEYYYYEYEVAGRQEPQQARAPKGNLRKDGKHKQQQGGKNPKDLFGNLIALLANAEGNIGNGNERADYERNAKG